MLGGAKSKTIRQVAVFHFVWGCAIVAATCWASLTDPTLLDGGAFLTTKFLLHFAFCLIVLGVGTTFMPQVQTGTKQQMIGSCVMLFALGAPFLVLFVTDSTDEPDRVALGILLGTLAAVQFVSAFEFYRLADKS